MIKIKAIAEFTVEGKSYSPKYIRPILNFGDGKLFSSIIESNDDVYLQGREYSVTLGLFSVEEDATHEITPYLNVGSDIAMQESEKRIIGIAKILGFSL
ncbi:MAG: hypothetical protein FWG68_12820 [Defluviitaleaceae bacterium]|nr:hypothetical protein [Defluviitaleaceae bacterium]